MITCGEHELDLQESGQINFYVTQVIVHPKYQGADKGYDIAIFKARPFSIDKCPFHSWIVKKLDTND